MQVIGRIVYFLAHAINFGLHIGLDALLFLGKPRDACDLSAIAGLSCIKDYG